MKIFGKKITLKKIAKTILSPLTLLEKPIKEIGKKAGLVETNASKRARAAEEQAALDKNNADIKDPAKALLGENAALAEPLALPTEADAERERRRAVLKAGLRSGRMSTILSDLKY